MERADREQIAAMGFIKAVQTFDASRSVFITHLFTCVHSALGSVIQTAHYPCRAVIFRTISIEENAIQRNADIAVTISDRLRSRVATPEQAVLFQDHLNQIRNSLTKKENDLLSGLLKGYTVAEIARDAGITQQALNASKQAIVRKVARLNHQHEQEASHV